MTTDHLRRLADDFWSNVPHLSVTRPRPIREAAELSLPLVVVELASLTPRVVGHWLRQRGVEADLHGEDALLGCLYARRGFGHVFVRAGGDAAAGRFTVAHEVAHFLLHHALPRRRAATAAGNGVLAALDGERPATTAERLNGALSSAVVAAHVHLLRADGEDAAEAEADALAALLLDLPRPPRRPEALVDWARRVLRVEATR